jgi:multicomponent Na+:H+ antiporter subunit B
VSRQIVLRIVAKLFIPFILLFALYVQFHGDYGPGGGFQAGVIFAAAFVLYGLVWGVERAKRVVNPGILQIAAALGVLLYAGTGLASLFLGGNFLDYSVLASDPIAGQHLGIFLVELGVGVAVAAVMTTIFLCFAARPTGSRAAQPEASEDRP